MKIGKSHKSASSGSRSGQKDSGIYAAFLQNESILKRFLRRFLYKQEDIDEISQETFLRAYKATQGREIDSPKAYLFQVARSLAYSELSRKTRKLTDYLEDALEDQAGTTDLLEDEYAAQQKVRLFFDAIAELPPQCRRVFLMRKVQGMPHKAISQSLGIGPSAVEKHIAIGTERCKRYIENREGVNNIHEATVTDLPDPKHMVRGQTHE
ncbi:MAG: RNA polymerase sigma factor [Porticoccaceae bacterium]|jgi:RNA polymerase sigma-70 factor (ECF subfamily)|nr:RNA polymerase sigma factor [Porticoccaceae bacterium]